MGGTQWSIAAGLTGLGTVVVLVLWIAPTGPATFLQPSAPSEPTPRWLLGVGVLLMLMVMNRVGFAILDRAKYSARTSVDPALNSWAGGARADGWDGVFSRDKSVELKSDAGKLRQSLQVPPGTSFQYICDMDHKRPELRRLLRLDNILTAQQCDRLLGEVPSISWTTHRHRKYPTMDVPLWEIPWLDEILSSQLRQVLLPSLAAAFGLRDEYLWINDLFLVKYDVGGQRSLEVHRDESLLSFVVQVNPLSAFQGGGTRFRQDCSGPVHVPQGSALLFCGQREHEGVAVADGTRLIIAGFVDYHPDAKGAKQVWHYQRRAQLRLPQLLSRLTRPYHLANVKMMCEDNRITASARDAGGQLLRAIQQGYCPANTSHAEILQAVGGISDSVGDMSDFCRQMRADVT
eukprot:CAMPEP_0204317570 /NCGR_PEP_ID=MMETSP0469-20131031/6044_1 /ASSEMBLY_ACC=CAM_ASM_000384 /TAXON_ID=2969 /ORGANISM="Oxyrrhis marina" /LENGTH=403 /DNA_ID=CAMNT_0051298509 /DNA_START=17 /DNA_END=1224 /DNA_ORIENTATION=+